MMNSRFKHSGTLPDRLNGRLRGTLLLSLLISLLITACNPRSEPSVVSEKPEALADAADQIVEPRPSRFGLRARVSYADVESILADQFPASYPVTGERQVCKRVIGLNVCGTAQWDIDVTRTAPLKISGQNQHLIVTTPIRFAGTVGVQGSAAEALGLSALQVQGTVVPTVNIGVSMQKNWCPLLSTEVQYRWLEQPSALWLGKVDFDLEGIVNDALDKQLATLEPRLNEAIDCQRFREQLEGYWRSYTFPLDVPSPVEQAAPQQLHLNIVPTGFAFSGIHTEKNKFGVSFELDGTTVVASTPLDSESLSLPPLHQVAFQASRTDFDLLLRADYTQLEEAIAPLLINQSFKAESAAGTVEVQIDNIELSGNTQGVTVALGFVAQLPGSWLDTHGVVYLNARPVVDTDAQQLRLENIELSRVLDSSLWNVVSSVFEGQIVAAIERGSRIDLSEHARKLEKRIQEQLQDPQRTQGVNVRADNLSIRLLGIFPEANALAARAEMSAELDIDIPLTVLKKPLK